MRLHYLRSPSLIAEKKVRVLSLPLDSSHVINYPKMDKPSYITITKEEIEVFGTLGSEQDLLTIIKNIKEDLLLEEGKIYIEIANYAG